MKRYYLACLVTSSRHPERIGQWGIADAHAGHRIASYRPTRDGAVALCAQMNRSARVSFSTPQKKQGRVA